MPDNGSVPSVRQYLQKLGIWSELEQSLELRGLEIDKLDDRELVLFLLSGVMEKGADKNVAWIPISDLIEPSFLQFDAFDPSLRWVEDSDDDGWPEYRLPQIGVIRFNSDRLSFAFAGRTQAP